MVRINLIEPRNLTDQHLLAEYNEILMLCGYVKKTLEKYYPSYWKDIPRSYKLGKGHIKFFVNKLEYLFNRFYNIKLELTLRDYAVIKEFPFNDVYPYIKEDPFNDTYSTNELWNNWTPTQSDYDIIMQRLQEKLKMKPNYYTYYGKLVKPDFYEV